MMGRLTCFVGSCVLAMNVVAHNPSTTTAAWDVCMGEAINTQCVYQNGAGDTYRGTCQAFSGNNVCVRNRPIEYASGVSQSSHEHSHPSEQERATTETSDSTDSP